MRIILLLLIIMSLSHADNVRGLACIAEREYLETEVNHTSILICDDPEMYKYRRCLEVNGVAVWDVIHECERLNLLYESEKFVMIKDKFIEIKPILSKRIDQIEISPPLPSGMSIDVNGQIRGSPRDISDAFYTIKARSGSFTNNQRMRITVISNSDDNSETERRDDKKSNVILSVSLVVMVCVGVIGMIVGITISLRRRVIRIETSSQHNLESDLINNQI